jgi:hypothetical protein
MLAFNMADARLVNVDRERAAGWLFEIRKQNFGQADYQEPAMPNNHTAKAKAAWVWQVAENAGLLTISKDSIQFYHQMLQDYFSTCYCLNHPLDANLLTHVLYGDFSDVWVLWSELDHNLLDKMVNALTNSENSQLRWLTVSALGYLRDVQAINPLLALFSDKEDSIGQAAAYTLIKYGETALRPLLNTLHSSNAAVRALGVFALGRIGNIRVVEALLPLGNDSDEKVRANAAEAYGLLCDNRSTETLLGLLQDESALVRFHAVKALGQLADLTILAVLEQVNQADVGKCYLGTVKEAATQAMQQIKTRNT